jgi:hypothetical protein
MRPLLVVTVFAVVAGTAHAAGVEPQVLVLRQSDVPAAYRLDASASGVKTNEDDVPPVRALFARWGRVTGYQADFRSGTRSVTSRVDLLRTNRGARSMLDWFKAEMRKAGIRGLAQRRAELGAEGWIYRARVGGVGFTVVAWRHGRLFAGVAVSHLGPERALALAHIVERRIVTALR